MITKNSIISSILLLTYSLAFAHNFIPHSHNAEKEIHAHSHQNSSHSHHHNTAAQNLNDEHEHISHRDHYDEGLYDLIICFLHDTNPHEDKCDDNFFIQAKTNNKLTSKSQKSHLINTLFVLTTEVEQPELTAYFNVNSNIPYGSLTLEDSPHRGPPAQKC